jgi:predicted MFS family arabinose efflux permease
VQQARIGLVLLTIGASTLPWLPGLVAVSAALFVTGLALAPTLIAIFSIIEAASPRSRLNEAMGIVQTGVGAGIAPGAWVAGVVADDAGGSSAYWVGAISALLAAAAMYLVPRSSRQPGTARLDSAA